MSADMIFQTVGNKYSDKINYIFSSEIYDDIFNINCKSFPAFINPMLYPFIFHNSP